MGIDGLHSFFLYLGVKETFLQIFCLGCIPVDILSLKGDKLLSLEIFKALEGLRGFENGKECMGGCRH